MHHARFAVIATFVVAFVQTGAAPAQDRAAERPPTFAPSDKGLKWEACPDGLPKACRLAVLNGDPAQPGADIFLKLPAKSKVPAHKHTSAERLVMLEGELTLTYEGRKPFTMRRGTYHFGPADSVHEAACISAQPCVLFIGFEKAVDLILVPGAFAATADAGKKPDAGTARASRAAAPTAAAGTPATARLPKKGGC